MYSLNSVLALFILVRKTNDVTHNLTLETTLNAGVNPLPLFVNWILWLHWRQNFLTFISRHWCANKTSHRSDGLTRFNKTSRRMRGDGRIQRLSIWGTSEITHKPFRHKWPELITVSVAWSKWRHCYYFPSGMQIHRRLNSRRNLFIPRGLFLKSPETLRAYFGCHNSLYIFSTPRSSKPSNFASLLVFLTSKTCERSALQTSRLPFHNWLFGHEKFSGLSRKRAPR